MTSTGDRLPSRLYRSPALRAYDHEATMTLLGADGVARRFTGDSAALVRAILDFAASPRTREEIAAHIADLAGEPVEGSDAVVDETISTLLAAGALREAPLSGNAAQPGGSAAPPRRRVVLGLTGAVAAMGAPALVEQLLARGHDVRVAATRNALRFVSALSLEALTHRPVCASMWPEDASAPVPHLDLAAWAEIVVIYPASAATLGRIAQGICSDVISALAISARCPVVIVPSMNDSMYTAPSVQRSLSQLREDGFFVVHPALGLEVADAPPARAPSLGAAPPAAVVVDLIGWILAEQSAGAPAGAPPAGP
jgi:3-polyprenyl-4-hydroxybenzoate decarboxylase